MKIENLQEKIRAELEKNCGSTEGFTPEQLHNGVSSAVMNELRPVWEKSRAAQAAIANRD